MGSLGSMGSIGFNRLRAHNREMTEALCFLGTELIAGMGPEAVAYGSNKHRVGPEIHGSSMFISVRPGNGQGRETLACATLKQCEHVAIGHRWKHMEKPYAVVHLVQLAPQKNKHIYEIVVQQTAPYRFVGSRKELG